jgi:hypothetical protein
MSFKNREAFHKPPSIIKDDYRHAGRRLTRQFLEKSAVNAGLSLAMAGNVDSFPVMIGAGTLIGLSRGRAIDIYQKHQNRLSQQERDALAIANAENDIEYSRPHTSWRRRSVNNLG